MDLESRLGWGVGVGGGVGCILFAMAMLAIQKGMSLRERGFAQE